MELKRYFALARRWVWLGILGLLLGAAGGYFYSAQQTPLYQASTRFVILMPAQTTDYYSYLNSQDLVQTYTQLLTTDRVLQDASAQLGYPVYAGQANAQEENTSQFVTLTVQDTDPKHAADIANILVSTLITQNEDLQSVRYATSEQKLQTQIDQVQTQITTLQAQINNISSTTVQQQISQVQGELDPLQKQASDLQNQITKLQNSYPTKDNLAQLADKQATLDQIQSLVTLYKQVYSNLVVLGQPLNNTSNGDPNSTSRLGQLQTTLNLYQQIYLNMLSSVQSTQMARVQNTPNVVQVEPAAVPLSPFSPHPLRNAALAGAIGLMLAIGIAFLVEYLDDTLKNSDDIERILKLPVIGYIAQFRYNSGQSESLYVTRQPRSPVTEAFRSLRTNLEFAGVDRPVRRLLVTSAGPNEGKTTISVNLAAVLAQSGKRVIIMDADMRRPSVHRFLGITNQLGLSDLFRGSNTLDSVMQRIEGQGNIYTITSGSLPPNPSELLASARMEQILQEAGREADMIVIDSPPALVTDVQIMASKVDGIIVVIHSGHTHADSALATMEQLSRAGGRVLGVVLNRIPRERADYYGGYRHYSPYSSGYHYYSYSRDEGGKSHAPSFGSAVRRFFSFGREDGHKDRKKVRDEALKENAGSEK
jgi:capsular exopolysaccharide synthesis family protein